MTTPQQLGWIVPELEVEAALAAGQAELRAAIAANSIDAYLERAFWNAPQAKRDEFKAWWLEHDVRVIQNYPRTPTETPCLAIVLNMDRETQYVGNGNVEAELEDGSHTILACDAWSSAIGVMCYAENPDMLLLLYQLGRFWLAGRRQALAAIFSLGVSLAGQDLGFEQRFLPHFVYRRGIQFTGEHFQLYARAAGDVVNVTDVVPEGGIGYASPGS